MNLRKILPAIETTIVWLFLLHAIRVLFSSLFGVIYDAVFEESQSSLVVGLNLLLVLAAFSTPLLLPRFERQGRVRLIAVLVVLIARVPISLEQPGVRLYLSILVLAGGAFYIAQLLLHESKRLMMGFVAAVSADQLLRALDYTYDPTLHPQGLPFVAVVALLTAVISIALSRQPIPAREDHPALIAGLALGAGIFVELSILALPNALSRWSGASYGWIAPLLLLVTLLPLVPAARATELRLAIFLWPLGGIVTIIIVVLCFAVAAILGGVTAAILLLITQLVFLFGFTTGIANKRAARDDAVQPPGIEMSLGFLLMLLLSFAFAFTFTYPYTLPVFRGLGTPVLLAGALVALLPIRDAPLEPEFGRLDISASALGLGGAVAVTVICGLLTRPTTLVTASADDTLRIATYNIHYGYDTDWVFNLEEIAQTIEDNNVDIIVLQEVDTARITSLSVDDALWLGQRLGMHSVFEPTLEKLSGIALLSRFPLADRDGQWLTSALEQTAIVHGEVETGYGPLHIYGLWLGLEHEERTIQLTEALNYIGSANPVALGGDFNAMPDSPIYARLLDADLLDPFVALEEDTAPTSPAVEPIKRIDYVWLRGLKPSRAWVPDSCASDHRMVVVEVLLKP